MKTQDLYQFRVILTHDSQTGQTVAQVPALDIADYGVDTSESLSHLQEMLAFHLECLAVEGKPIPQEESQDEGLYLQVRVPIGAA